MSEGVVRRTGLYDKRVEYEGLGTDPDGYAYRAFARFGWLARWRMRFAMWRHEHGWPEPDRRSWLHRVLAGKRLR